MQVSPYSTGAAAISGAAVGNMIAWVCTLFKIQPPPPDVSSTMGAVAITIAHYVVVRFTPSEQK